MKFMKKNLCLQCDSDEEDANPFGNSFSCEIGSDGLKFIKENLQVHQEGLKNIETGEFLANIHPKDLLFQNVLGRGASGYVQKALHKTTGIAFAIKSINAYDRDKRHQLMNDLRAFMHSNCPFLVQFYGAYFEEGMVKVVLELMDIGSIGDVIKYLKEKPLLRPNAPLVPEPILSKLTQQMLNGLLYLHKCKRQVHRDIKPDNILMNSKGEVKLSDFGISKELQKTAALCNTFVGTVTYMSPERILGTTYSYGGDVWSLGLVIMELATGIYPYSPVKAYMDMLDHIITSKPPSLPTNGTFTSLFQDFLNRCLQKDPTKRDSVAELCAHPWILEYSQYDMDLMSWIYDIKKVKKRMLGLVDESAEFSGLFHIDTVEVKSLKSTNSHKESLKIFK